MMRASTTVFGVAPDSFEFMQEDDVFGRYGGGPGLDGAGCSCDGGGGDGDAGDGGGTTVLVHTVAPFCFRTVQRVEGGQSKSPLLIAVIVLVLVVIAAIAVIVYFRGCSDNHGSGHDSQLLPHAMPSAPGNGITAAARVVAVANPMYAAGSGGGGGDRPESGDYGFGAAPTQPKKKKAKTKKKKKKKKSSEEGAAEVTEVVAPAAERARTATPTHW